jgi:hypothetical protein
MMMAKVTVAGCRVKGHIMVAVAFDWTQKRLLEMTLSSLVVLDDCSQRVAE